MSHPASIIQRVEDPQVVKHTTYPRAELYRPWAGPPRASCIKPYSRPVGLLMQPGIDIPGLWGHGPFSQMGGARIEPHFLWALPWRTPMQYTLLKGRRRHRKRTKQLFRELAPLRIPRENRSTCRGRRGGPRAAGLRGRLHTRLLGLGL